jgi:hypothetical protein
MPVSKERENEECFVIEENNVDNIAQRAQLDAHSFHIRWALKLIPS